MKKKFLLVLLVSVLFVACSKGTHEETATVDELVPLPVPVETGEETITEKVEDPVIGIEKIEFDFAVDDEILNVNENAVGVYFTNRSDRVIEAISLKVRDKQTDEVLYFTTFDKIAPSQKSEFAFGGIVELDASSEESVLKEKYELLSLDYRAELEDGKVESAVYDYKTKEYTVFHDVVKKAN